MKKVSKSTDPKFNRDSYLIMISEIRKEMKKSGLNRENGVYYRVYSEPRKKTGYRTKFWCMDTKHAQKVQDICEKLFPGIFNVFWKECEPGFNCYYSREEYVEIVPVRKADFIGSRVLI